MLWLHRWLGLLAAPYLLVVALTGSIIAFYAELDRALNPELLTVPVREQAVLDPLVLRARAESIEPRATADGVAFRQLPGQAFTVWLTPRVDPRTGNDYDLGFNQMMLDPYTGELLGKRQFAAMSLERKNVMPLVYRLHYSLLLPGKWHETGRLILGLVALAWTIDCFIGFYLTLPRRRSRKVGHATARTWLQRWLAAWKIETRAARFRIFFDMHRAFGLWLWAMLFVFAWSGVAFNLSVVYQPIMSSLLPSQRQELRSGEGDWMETPKLEWNVAHAVGRRLMDELLSHNGFTVESEAYLNLDRQRGVYVYGVRSTADAGAGGLGTHVFFDANSGELTFAGGPGSMNEYAGDIAWRWLTELHTARVFGFPYQVFVCFMGLVIAMLSVTGIYIWWSKRKVRRRYSIPGN